MKHVLFWCFSFIVRLTNSENDDSLEVCADTSCPFNIIKRHLQVLTWLGLTFLPHITVSTSSLTVPRSNEARASKPSGSESLSTEELLLWITTSNLHTNQKRIRDLHSSPLGWSIWIPCVSAVVLVTWSWMWMFCANSPKTSSWSPILWKWTRKTEVLIHLVRNLDNAHQHIKARSSFFCFFDTRLS